MQEEDSKDEDSYNEDARGGGQNEAYLIGRGLESGRTNEDAAN